MSLFRGSLGRIRQQVAALRLLAVIAASVAAVSACSSASGAGSGSAGEASQAPVSGGTLTLGLSLDPRCLDPHQAYLSDALYAIRPLVDSLTAQDPKTGAIMPWLAQSWQVNANATQFTFHLRPGVTFSNGTPVNAQVLKDNLDDIVQLGAKSPEGSSYLAGYKDTVVVNDLTAKVEFTQPTAQFLQATTSTTLGLVSESTLAESAAQRCLSGITGSGPFVLDSQTTNASVVESRRAGYDWGPSTSAHTGAAYLAKLDFEVVPDSEVRSGSLKSGQLDGIVSVAAQDQPGIVSAGFIPYVSDNAGVVANLEANPNPDRPIVSDPAVRQAVQVAVNRQQLVSTVLGSEYAPATSILAHSTPDYADLSSELAYNPAKAEALLNNDGWKVGPGGIRVKDGRQLNLVVIWGLTLAADQSLLQLVQQELKQVGINLKLDEVSNAQFLAAYESGQFDFFWGDTTRADPDILRLKFTTPSPVPGSPRAQLDTVLQQQGATLNATARASLVRQAQQLIIQNAFSIPIYEQATVMDFSANVHGFAFDASSLPRFSGVWLSS